MRYSVWEDSEKYPVALLIKASSFNKQDLQTNYITALEQSGVPVRDVIAFTLSYNEAGKAPAKFIKEYLAKLLWSLESLGTKYLYVADSSYFKVLAGKPITVTDPAMTRFMMTLDDAVELVLQQAKALGEAWMAC